MSVVGNVEQRNQWRSVSADSHIGWTKIGDDGSSETCCKHRAFAGLPRRRDGVPKKIGGCALVIKSLTVATDEIDVDLLILGSLGDCLGIKLTEKKVQACKIGDTCGTRIHSGEYCLAHRVWVIEMFVHEQPQTKGAPLPHDANECNIDTIGRGAAHHAGDDHSRLAADSFSTSCAKSCIFVFRFSISAEVGSFAIVCLSALLDALRRKTRSAERVTSSANLRSFSASWSTAS